MSGGDDDFEDFGDLDLDLEDALDAWEQEIEKDGTISAESSPMPQHSEPPKAPDKPAEAARPLYRPDPELMGRKPAAMQSRRVSSPDDFSSDFDDEQESTRIASVPADLMAELQALRGEAPAEPEVARPRASEPELELEAVDLDLDDFLDENDEVTRVGSVEDDLTSMEQELLDPFADEASAPAAAAEKPSAESTLDVSIDALAGGDDVVASPAPEQRVTRPADESATPAVPKPAAPKPAAPKPRAPALSKPAVPKPAVPKPAVPKPAIPRPAVPRIPKPTPRAQGDRPSIPRPSIPRPPSRAGSPPRPPIPVPKPRRPGAPPPVAGAIPKPVAPPKPARGSLERVSTMEKPAAAPPAEPESPMLALDEPSLDLPKAEPPVDAGDRPTPTPDDLGDRPTPVPDELDLDFGTPKVVEVPADEPRLSLDEPELEIGDEPELAIGDEPDLEIGDEPDLAFGDDLDLDDPEPMELLVDDDEPQPTEGAPSQLLDLVPPGESDAPPKPDQGAATAKRTVGQRKPRKERYAFVGHDTDTRRRRRQLLEKLAEGAEGIPKARLLVAAAEIAEALGDIDDARSAMEQARDLDPSDLGILRWWRRDAVARGDWSEVARLLEEEAKLPLSPADMDACLTLLAEVRLTQLNDPTGAAEAARKARESHGPSLVTSLIGGEALRGDDPVTAAAQLVTAGMEDDADLEIAVRLLAGRLLERSGELDAAAQAYGTAVARARRLEPLIGLARTSPSASRRRDALRAAAESVSANPAFAECLRRAASRIWLAHGDDPAVSVATLEAAQRPTSLRLQAMAAQRADDPETRRLALHALSGASGGTVRALALLDLAELQAAGGELDAADESLREAALADPNLDAVQAVREVLARRAGDPSRLAAAIESSGNTGRGAIEAAAKLASAPEDLAKERQELVAAANEGAQPIMADLLTLDAAAEAHDTDAVVAGLQREAQRLAPERRLGALLALAERSDPRAALTQASEAMPGRPGATRPLARLLGESDPAAAGEAWLTEAANAIDARAAHAATVAARYFAEANAVAEALGAAQQALDALPGHGPAAWILDGDLGAGLDGEYRTALFESLGETLGADEARAWAWARRALLGGEGASEAWERASELHPDPVCEELALGSGEGAAAQAARLEERATRQPTMARSTLLRAGLGYERGGEPKRAAAIYEGLLKDGHDPLADRALDRAQLAAGDLGAITSRRFAAVREAEGTPRELAALEDLARVDLHGGGDPSNAALTLQTIVSQKPGHLPSLRALERFYMDGGRDPELRGIWESMVAHMPDAMDRLGPARLAAHLRLGEAEAPGDAADALWAEHGQRLLEASEPTADRIWVARRVSATHPDAAVRGRAWLAEADSLADDERAAVLLTGLPDIAAVEGALERAERIESVAARLTEHPLLPEAAARQHVESNSHAAAADAYRRAAAQTSLPARRMPLLYLAGRSYEAAEQRAEAKAAFLEASQIDVTYHDLFERVRDMLEQDGDTADLADLADRRLAAGGDATVMRSLRRTQAALKATMGDRAGARDALRAALELDPQDVDALRRLAELSLQDQDWRGAAEALIRFARLRQDRDDLRWVFFTLGDIYQRHMPDTRRAEAAYRRCLKLIPDDLEAMDRLAQVYESEAAFDKAAKVVSALSKAEIDPDAKQQHLLRLARMHEQAGDLRTAERVLDTGRKANPTDLVVLRAMAELYQRQNAAGAQSMHLNRAIGDFHRSLEKDLTNPFAWEGLAEMHEWRGEKDAGRAVASAAAAVGIMDDVILARLDANGAAPGVGAAAADPRLHEHLAPRMLSAATFELFRLGAEIFDKVLPFDSRAWKTEKVGRDHPLRVEALRVAQWFGYGDVTVLITDVAPRICVPVSGDPLTFVVGRALSTSTDAHERAFLFARATKVAISGLSVAMRTHPGQLALCFAGLAKTYDPMYTRADLDRRELEDWARRVGKAIPRKVRDNLGPVAIEVVASANFDASSLGLAAAELGDRAALLAVGAVPAATRALLALADLRPDDGASPKDRVAAMRQVPEAWDLLRFAISDAYFEARRRAGADRM